jgi:EAL domain-containing protein (putative c-di-GMP-specific phosphodiesterase class I)
MATSAEARTGRVLVVEDEPALLKSYARRLQAAGHTVERAVDGTTAAALIAQSRFDVIVSDIAMPGLSGVQLLRSVREADAEVPVILITGAPDVDTAIRAVEYGALRYLVKPFPPDELAALVREALRPAGSAALDSLGESLDRALATLWVAYQPIVSWATHSCYAFEALLRTAEPTLARPDLVLGAAERLNRLPDVGRRVRACVAATIVDAPAEFAFVNLHGRDLLDDELYDPAAPLSRVASRIVLEVTERVALDEIPDAKRRIAALRALGFRLAVDDLGAGYAGLSSLAQLEPEVVKLDMSLVRGVHESETKQRLVESMTRLCRDLGALVVAEGVETAPERDALLASGCDLFQGYLFARPAQPFPLVHW